MNKLVSSVLGAAVLSSALLGLGCARAYADRPGPRAAWQPAQALAIAPARIRAPYDVSILSEGGDTLQTFGRGGRYYLLGDTGERYIIRVSNPTARRIEAVVTVDGLDVIDGEGGDLHKRGYVIQPYGELRVEGFRTSTTEVATFRFSSVASSYAGRKGKARNVGVIAVALFEEEAPPPPPPPPQIIIDEEYDDDRYYGPVGGATRSRDGAAGKVAAKPVAPSDGDRGGGGAGADSAEAAPSISRAPSSQECCAEQRRERPGLGTEYGEQRYSAAQYTRFTRSSTRPIAIAELRYNDAAGLIALGIPVQPVPDADEISTRETADPFPGDRFARPPAGIR
ncbi:MAG: hypothetical protein KBG28_08175 [Kofleriaceae bacterium]|nr:hypothetical protein [Kofleriaceae bacterium]MBP9203921.1 hypothetical protein [Kofleriaceae bacterium]